MQHDACLQALRLHSNAEDAAWEGAGTGFQGELFQSSIYQGGIYTKKSETYTSVFKNYPDVVTVEQMSEMLGISTKTAYKLLKENKIKHFMIGRIYKIPKYYILTYLEILDQKNSNP